MILSAGVGASVGVIQKIAPSVVESPTVSVQVSSAKPGDAAMALGALPSVTPMVSHESNSAYPKAALLAIGKNCGLAPPMCVPNGVAHWYAGGISSGACASPNRA
jgi:hypothetical protein